MFVTAKILVEENNVRAVPKSSLVEEGEEKFIFVKTNEKHEDEHNEPGHKEGDNDAEHKEDEHKGEHGHEGGVVFKKVMVRTGVEDDKYVEIFPIETIEGDNEVVTLGAFYLRSELKKGELGEHDH